MTVACSWRPDAVAGTKAGEPHCPEAGAWFDFQIKQLASWNQHMSGPPAGPAPPSPAPSPAAGPSGTCAQAFAQSGGSKDGGAPWSGPACCPEGYACTQQSQFYSQCYPTADTVAASQHNGLFAAHLAAAHARNIVEARAAAAVAA